jgi:short-subunit dehydrogenase
MKIIITGASKGLGKVLAEKFVAAGNNVGLVARSATKLTKIASDLSKVNNKEKIHVSACDLNNSEETQEAISLLIRAMGGIDVLINNASITIKKSILEMTIVEWQESISTGMNAAFHCSRAVLPYYIKQTAGHIINIGSLSSKIPLERGISYTASKQALSGFSSSMVHELHGFGIKICTIHPGAFTVEFDETNSWKMPAVEVYRACEYVLNSHPKAFVEELIVRPLNWPE